MTTMHDQEPTRGQHGNVRASDTDRERAVDVLNAAFAEGRLAKEEHDARVGRAFTFQTLAELQELSADLPAGPFGALPSFQGSTMAARLPVVPPRTNRLAVASLVCGLIPGIPQIAAIILGIAAHRQMRQTGERGAAQATAGLALGMLGVLLGVLVIFGF